MTWLAVGTVVGLGGSASLHGTDGAINQSAINNNASYISRYDEQFCDITEGREVYVLLWVTRRNQNVLTKRLSKPPVPVGSVEEY